MYSSASAYIRPAGPSSSPRGCGSRRSPTRPCAQTSARTTTIRHHTDRHPATTAYIACLRMRGGFSMMLSCASVVRRVKISTAFPGQRLAPPLLGALVGAGAVVHSWGAFAARAVSRRCPLAYGRRRGDAWSAPLRRPSAPRRPHRQRPGASLRGWFSDLSAGNRQKTACCASGRWRYPFSLQSIHPHPHGADVHRVAVDSLLRFRFRSIA